MTLQAGLLPWLPLTPLLSAHFRANPVLTCVRSGRVKHGGRSPPAPGLLPRSKPRLSGALSARSPRPSYPFWGERQPTSTNTAPPAKLWRTAPPWRRGSSHQWWEYTAVGPFPLVDCSYCVYYLCLINSEENIWLQNTFLYLLHHISSWYGYIYSRLCVLMQFLPRTPSGLRVAGYLVTHSIFLCWMRASRWFLITEWREGWRPSNKEGYRGHNMAAPLSRGIKVGQSVPWMISNSTFWGPIH